MNITKHQQSGFIFESQGKRIALDIGRLTTEEELATIGNVDAAVVSHLHGDHCMPAHLEKMTKEVYTVQEAADTIQGTKLNIHIHKIGDTVSIEGTPFTVKVFPSDHGPHAELKENTALLISDGTLAVYFLGDMFNPAVPIADTFDALLIPVGNGNYTFGPQEAAMYVRELQWDGLTIPMHYNAMQQTEHTASEFATILADEAFVKILEIGESTGIV
jgi:L-ascorbate metabolism protein UlaG (beta-lactamase superfamily)